MTVNTWCKANDICEQTYYPNLKELRTEMIESFQVLASDEKTVTFKKLEVCTPISRTQAVMLAL